MARRRLAVQEGTERLVRGCAVEVRQVALRVALQVALQVVPIEGSLVEGAC